MSRERKEIYEFGPFRLDVGEHVLQRTDGVGIQSLPEKAFQTLCVLVKNNGHLMSKRDLLDLVWPGTFVEENNLDKSIHAIRNALGEKAGSPKYVETVRKHGYRFIADVHSIGRVEGGQDGFTLAESEPKHSTTDSGQHPDALHAEGRTSAEQAETIKQPSKLIQGSRAEQSGRGHDADIQSAGDAEKSSQDRPKRTVAAADSHASSEPRDLRFLGTSLPLKYRRRWPFVAAGLFALLGLLFVLNAGGLLKRAFGTAAEPVKVRSLAVLPLKNLSDDAQAYFVDGMTEALVTDLARIGALRIVSGQSAVQYKDSVQTVPEIGRELNADAVLTGSVVRSGDRVRIAVQLVHAMTDQNLWAQNYERNLQDVLALQREIARDVAEKVRIALTPQEQLRFGPAAAINPVAYDHYLRGKFYLNRQNKDENAVAIASLESAVAAGPAFAAAHAELAQAYAWKLFLFDPNDKALAEKAFVEVEKALALDPDLAVAYLARGRLLWTPANRFPSEKAIREYRRALDLNPNLDEARNQLALVYNHVGALDEALRELEFALETNPHNSLAEFRVAETILFQGKYEEALARLRRVPDDANRALVGHQIVWALFNLGRKEEAVVEMERFLKEFPDDNRGLITSQQAVLAASEGQERTAHEKIRLAVENGKGFGHFHHTAYFIACAYALMNKPEQAVEWLKFAAENGFPNYPLFERDESLQEIKQDSRFIAFMAKLKPQWERFKSL